MSHLSLCRSVVVTVFASALLAACTSPAIPHDASGNDVVAIPDHSEASATDHTTPVDATTDTPAPMDAGVDTALDTAVPTDSPAPTDVRDVPAADRNPAPCTLPLGGTCAPGTTCPAGDGCNDCVCPPTGGTANCTRRACVDAAVDAPVTGCRGPSDCRLYSSYCTTAPCVCFPLSVRDPDPTCTGGSVTCIIDPCVRNTADCVAGVCVLR